MAAVEGGIVQWFQITKAKKKRILMRTAFSANVDILSLVA